MGSHVEDFYASVIRNDVGAVRASLLADPLLVSARDSHLGSTPLHFAAHRGLVEIVQALLERGADVHALERASGSSPLHWAAEGGHPDVARLLLARGAALEARDAWHGLTPLGWATAVTWAPQHHEDRPATARLLRAAGARPDAFTELGAGDLEGLRRVVLADRTELDRRLGFAGEEMRPLHWAVAHGMAEAAALLLELGADLAARTALGLTPLGAALRPGQGDAAGVLVQAGATVDVSTAAVGGNAAAIGAADAETLTAELASRLLFVAAEEGHADAIQALLQRGADAAARVRRLFGEVPMLATPLHAAAEHGREAAAKVLLDAGAPLGAGLEDGAPTPLHLAAGKGHEVVARVLVERGADRTARERGFDATPSDWAAAAGHRKLAALLRDPAWPPRPASRQAG
jgi:ankyrin repeat protein